METPTLNEVNIYSWNLQDINDLDAYSVNQSSQLLYDYLQDKDVYQVFAFVDNIEYNLNDFLIQEFGDNIIIEIHDNILFIYRETEEQITDPCCVISVEKNYLSDYDKNKKYDFYLSRINLKYLIYTKLEYNEGDKIVTNQQFIEINDYCRENEIDTIIDSTQNLSDIKLKEFKFGINKIFGNCYYKNYYKDPDNVVVKLYDQNNNKYTSVSNVPTDSESYFCYLLKKKETEINSDNNYYEYIIDLFINSFRDFENGNGFNFYGVSELFNNDIMFNQTSIIYYDIFNLINFDYRIYFKAKKYNLCFVLQFKINNDGAHSITINNYDIDIEHAGSKINNSFEVFQNNDSIGIYKAGTKDLVFSIKINDDKTISFQFSNDYSQNLLQCDDYYFCFYEPFNTQVYDDFHVYSELEINKMFQNNIQYINNYFKNCCIDNGVHLGNPIVEEPALIKDALDLNKYSKVLVRFYDKDNHDNKFSTDFFVQKNNYSWKTDYIIISKLLITRGFDFFESEWFDSFNERLNKSEFCTLLAWNEEEKTGNGLTFALDNNRILHKFKEGVKLSEINTLIEDENITPNNN